MVLPGTGKNFDQFRIDDVDCRQYASLQAGGTAQQAQVDSGVKSAAIGTAVGAAAGAAMGGQSGAATGAGVGLVMGSAAGASSADMSARGMQRRYDNGYIQCMYAKGHKVPVAGRIMSQQPARQTPPPPPPPPPSSPPPEPAK